MYIYLYMLGSAFGHPAYGKLHLGVSKSYGFLSSEKRQSVLEYILGATCFEYPHFYDRMLQIASVDHSQV